MIYSPSTIMELVDSGYATNTSGIVAATKINGQWRETSIEDFKTNVRHFALGLYKLGVRKGDTVAIHSENRSEWLISDQAILSIGAVDVPIYTSQHGAQVKFILEDSDATVYIFSKDELVSDSWNQITSAGNVENYISIDPSSNDSIQSFDQIIELGQKLDEDSPELFEQLKNEVDPDDLATLMYTSGTTGSPKGVMLSHNNIASNMNASLERIPFSSQPNPKHKMLSYLPLSHVFERTFNYMYLTLGYPVYYIENIDEIRDDLVEIEPHFMATVPRLLEKIYIGVKGKGQDMKGIQKTLFYWALHLLNDYDPVNPPKGLQALKFRIADKLVYKKIRTLFGRNFIGVISGGAALSKEIMRFINGIGLYCGQGYGLSETSPVITGTKQDRIVIGSSGPPLSNVEVKIAEDGEILAKGPNVMKGYYKQPDKTTEVLTEDGWFKTGDVGYTDNENNLYITDRKNSMFKLSTGKYVAPQPIENDLVNSPFIDQAVVIGYQKKFCSALIVPSYSNINKRFASAGGDEHMEASKQQIREVIQKEIEKVNANHSKWEQVKKFAILEEPLSVAKGELTPTLKVKRPVVNKKYANRIQDLYEAESEKSEATPA